MSEQSRNLVHVHSASGVSDQKNVLHPGLLLLGQDVEIPVLLDLLLLAKLLKTHDSLLYILKLRDRLALADDHPNQRLVHAVVQVEH